MKALSRYNPDVAYGLMSEDTTHIIVPLEVHELTKGFAPDFYSLLDDIHATAKQEEALTLAVFRAEGLILAVDGDVDVLVTNILNAALASVGNNKEHPFYVFLVGDQTAGEIRDPVLGEELDTVRTWVAPLQASSDPLLAKYGSALDMKVAEADQRIAQLAVAEQALKAFKEIGGRKQLVDRANALRAATYGTLTQMIDAQPDANLPGDFADRVFRYERIRRRRKPVTAAELQKQIAANEKEHTALAALLATTQEAEAAAKAAKAKAKAKPVEDALDAAKKKQAAVQAEIAALQAKLPPATQP
jgi:hypothetical protein